MKKRLLASREQEQELIDDRDDEGVLIGMQIYEHAGQEFIDDRGDGEGWWHGCPVELARELVHQALEEEAREEARWQEEQDAEEARYRPGGW